MIIFSPDHFVQVISEMDPDRTPHVITNPDPDPDKEKVSGTQQCIFV